MSPAADTNKPRSYVKSGALAGWLPAAFRVVARLWCRLVGHDDEVTAGDLLGDHFELTCRRCENSIRVRLKVERMRSYVKSAPHRAASCCAMRVGSR